MSIPPHHLQQQPDTVNDTYPPGELPSHLMCKEYEIQLADAKEQMLSLYDKIDLQTDLISKYKKVID